MLSQFTGADAQQTLTEFIDRKGFYAAGRLDKDSEGLLILTDDGSLQQQIADPDFKLAKGYLAQVEGTVDAAAVLKLIQGVELKDGVTRPAGAVLIDPPNLWPRQPPIRERKHIPTSWIELTLFEGRNRQIRRMTAAVGFPTLRLVRIQIGKWKLGGLAPGQWRLLQYSR